MSGILGQLLGGVLGNQQGGGGQPSSGGLAAVLQQVLASDGGGVTALVQRFEAAGLGSQAQSWIGTGGNAPVTPEQIDRVFPDEKIAAWAEQAGTSPEQLRAVLAQALPHAVDHATPGGQVPPAGTMPDLSALIGRFFESPR